MPRKHRKPEEIVAKLRRVDVLVSQGQSVADAVRAIGVTEVTYYRWRQEFGGLKTDQVKRMKELEAENGICRKFRRHMHGCTDIDGCCVWIDHRKPGVRCLRFCLALHFDPPAYKSGRAGWRSD